jgi:hypothetical protein
MHLLPLLRSVHVKHKDQGEMCSDAEVYESLRKAGVTFNYLSKLSHSKNCQPITLLGRKVMAHINQALYTSSVSEGGDAEISLHYEVRQISLRTVLRMSKEASEYYSDFKNGIKTLRQCFSMNSSMLTSSLLSYSLIEGSKI